MYTEAGLEWLERRERREWLNTLLFVWLVSAAAAALLVIASGDSGPALILAVLAVAATAYLVTVRQGEPRRAALRRRLIRELAGRADELDPADAEVTLERLHTRRRRPLFVAAVLAWVCSVPIVAAIILGSGDVAGPLIVCGVFLAIVMWIVVSGLRKLDRDFDHRRADTRELLARRGESGGASPPSA